MPTTVHHVMLDDDFCHELAAADHQTEPDEAPQLNHYVRHRPGRPADNRSFWPDSAGFPTPGDAITAAGSAVPGAVTWQ